MKKIKLNHEHTCNCIPCMKIPQLFVQGKSMESIKMAHSCKCQVCIANMDSLRNVGALRKTTRKHTCDCAACTENQKILGGEKNDTL